MILFTRRVCVFGISGESIHQSTTTTTTLFLVLISFDDSRSCTRIFFFKTQTIIKTTTTQQNFVSRRASKIRTRDGRGHVRERRRRKKRNNNVFSFSSFVFFFFSARRGASILAGSQFPRLPSKRRRMCSLSHACVFCNHHLSYFFFTSQRVIKDAHI